MYTSYTTECPKCKHFVDGFELQGPYKLRMTNELKVTGPLAYLRGKCENCGEEVTATITPEVLRVEIRPTTKSQIF